MSDDIFNISFDEIVKQSEEAENTEIERVLEINSYEKLYLLKPNENGDPSCELSDEEKLSLYHDVVFSGLRRYYVENLAHYTQLYGSIATIVVVLLWLCTVSLVGASSAPSIYANF